MAQSSPGLEVASGLILIILKKTCDVLTAGAFALPKFRALKFEGKSAQKSSIFKNQSEYPKKSIPSLFFFHGTNSHISQLSNFYPRDYNPCMRERLTL